MLIQFGGITAGARALLLLFGIVAAVFVFVCPASAGPVTFDREAITIWIEPHGIRVEGVYTFTNPAPADFEQQLYYPFPIDSLHPVVDSISVSIGGSEIEYKQTAMGIGFAVPMEASGSATVVVRYDQSSLDNSGCYILTSTSAWNAPIKEARFVVHVPDTLELSSSSYEFDTVKNQTGESVCELTRTDFMPDEDLCLEWRRRERPRESPK